MRMSRLFCQTLRESPAEAGSVGLRLLLRAGFLRPLASGGYCLLPLAVAVKQRLEQLFREEVERLGGQEVELPVTRPGEMGRKAEGEKATGSEKQEARREHEEALAELVRRQVSSYRQLPLALYYFGRETGTSHRGALIPGLESSLMGLGSFHAGIEDLDRFYGEVHQAFWRVLGACGLVAAPTGGGGRTFGHASGPAETPAPTGERRPAETPAPTGRARKAHTAVSEDEEPLVAVAEVGEGGEETAHLFVLPAQAGEETILLCPSGDYCATRRAAVFARQPLPREPLLPLEEVWTLECKTIEALARFLGIPEARTAKTIFFMAGEELLFVMVRGDMAVNEAKLARLAGATSLRSATAEEIRAAGAVPGYASPIGLREVKVVVDDLIPESTNLVAGANREGYHLRNVNYGRDFTAALVGDIVAAEEGYPCVRCGAPLSVVPGAPLGITRRRGSGGQLGASYLDAAGTARPVVMGSYFLEAGQLMASVAESSHDEKGLVWPAALAPYQLYLMTIGADRPGVTSAADHLYRSLWNAGVETLYDDRAESAGVKFGDCDLIGLPLRLTVSPRGLAKGEVELKRRRDGQQLAVSLEDALGEVQRQLDQLR